MERGLRLSSWGYLARGECGVQGFSFLEEEEEEEEEEVPERGSFEMESSIDRRSRGGPFNHATPTIKPEEGFQCSKREESLSLSSSSKWTRSGRLWNDDDRYQ